MKPALPSKTWLAVEGLAQTFGTTPVFAGLSFTLAQGETLAVIGPSGSGKTTLLRLLAGLDQADAGRVLIQQRDVTALTPAARGAIYLYQEALLFPHLDVFENIAFGLRLRGWSRAAIAGEVEAMLSELELSGYAQRRPERACRVVNASALLLAAPWSSSLPSCCSTNRSAISIRKHVQPCRPCTSASRASMPSARCSSPMM